MKTTTSRCPTCLIEIAAQVVRVGDQVRMVKACPAHGRFEVVLANDARSYHLAVGAPKDSCGCASSTKDLNDPFETLSTCVALIEIVDSCNLACPTCYASSPVGVDDNIQCTPADDVIDRIGRVVGRKGFIDILQLSGGEPTIHPEFLKILDWAIANQDIGYVLINTNGVRIAHDRTFRDALADRRRAAQTFELYIQFDGPQEEGQFELRGADLRDTRRQAIDEAGAVGIPSTLAMVVTPQTILALGDALRFGLQRPHCRGLTLQPLFTSGRVTPIEGNVVAGSTQHHQALSVGDVIKAITEQAPEFISVADFTPLPCGDPNCHTIGYLLRTGDGVVGLNTLLDLPELQGFLDNRLNYRLEDLARCGCETEPLGELLKAMEIGPEQPFRIFIKPFMDGWTFDQDRIDRCCTHVIRPDGSLDSFCRHYLGTGR